MTEEGRLDRAFVERVLAGDLPAREEFAERMDCLLHYLACLNSRQGSPLRHDELKELHAVVLARVCEKLPTFAGRSRLETWAMGFCYWELQRALNDRSAHDRRAEPLDEDELEAPVAPLPEDDLAPYLKHLTPMQRRVLYPRVVLDQQLEEIAAELGISVSTAGTYWQRALERLRAVFGNSASPA